MANNPSIKLYSVGGLDLDSDLSKIANEDYPYAENMRNSISYGNSSMVPVNMNGNSLVAYTLGTATYICLGSLEDKQNSIFYFVWASDNKHKILRYYPGNTNNNPLGEIQLVYEYNFGWSNDERITGIDFVNEQLLYWVDSIKPRKIDVIKGNCVNKFKTWDFTMPVNASGAYGFQVSAVNLISGAVTTENINLNGATREILLEQFAVAINTHGLQGIFNAEACGCSVTITEKVVNTYNFTSSLFQVVPANWYGLNLIDRFSDACKYVSQYPPIPSYIIDPTRNYNFVKNHVFQFRIEYIFDNFEQSVLSPISNISVNNLNCDGTNNVQYNAIDINFNDPLLTDPNTWVIVKTVNIMVRELNTGKWLQINQLNYCDFIEQVGLNLVCHCVFYNNELTQAVSEVLSNQNFDNLPIKANAQKFASNKIAYGGITENYTGPDCVEADYRIKILPSANKPLRKVTIFVRILTFGLALTEQRKGGGGNGFFDFFSTANKYPFAQPPTPGMMGLTGSKTCRGAIFQNIQAASLPYWGGGSFNAAGVYGQRAGMETTWNQATASAGFPIYCAGEAFLGVTKQKLVGLPCGSNNALDTSTAQYIVAIGNYFTSGDGIGGPGDIYSEVTLMLPDGDHILRVASPQCSPGSTLGAAYDLNGNLYQKTSANVMGYFDATDAWKSEKEIVVTVAGTDIANAGTFVVMDLAPPEDANMNEGAGQDFWQPLNLYLYDGTGNPLGQANDNMNSIDYDGVSIEKAVVGYGTTSRTSSFANQPPYGPFGSNFAAWKGWQDTGTTDHNGYFFGINSELVEYGVESAPSIANIPIINAIQVGPPIPNITPMLTPLIVDSIVIWQGTFTNYFAKTLAYTNYNPTINPPTSTPCIFGFVTTLIANAREDCSTFITGQVTDQNGHALSGVSVVYENGRTATTDTNGNYEVLAWGDMVTTMLGQGNRANVFAPTSNDDRVVDYLLFIANALCNVTYPNGQFMNSPIDISAFGPNPAVQVNIPPYSPTSIIFNVIFIINEVNGGSNVTRKRGGKYLDGVEYLDWALRSTAAFLMYEIYIPFETEDLSLFPKVVQANNTPYPPGSFVGGIPVIEWFITSAPPQFAWYYQLMRTKNNIQAKYFQWAVNSVQYLSRTAYVSGGVSDPQIPTSYSNGDAVAIDISLSNIIQFNQANPKSTITGYSFTAGDRLRLIYDQNGTLIKGLYDFEILGLDQAGTGIIIAAQNLPFPILAGFQIEIYTPNSSETTSQEEFYETGNVFPCTAPGQPNNAHSVTSGTFADGDTWWGGLLVPVDDPLTGFIGVYPLSVESQSISPFYLSLAEDIGRGNKIDPFLVQEYKYTALRVSNTFIPDSQINGLSAFQDVDDIQLDLSFGAIMGLVTTGFVLGAVCQNKFVSNYLGATVGAKTDGGLEIASQQGFVGDSRPLLGDFGTQHPATIVEKDGHVFFADFERGIVGEYSDNGIEEIQKFKVRNFFRQFMISGVWDALAAYDAFYGEYILTAWVNRQDSGIVTGIGDRAGIPPCYLLNVANPQTYSVGQPVIVEVVDSTTGLQSSVEGTIRYIDVSSLWIQLPGTYNFIRASTRWNIVSKGQGYTIAFQKDKRRWTTFYSFQPEQMQGVGMNFVTWESGTLWLHDRGPINTFYGTYFPWLLNLVATEPQQRDQPIKTWVAFRMSQLEGNTDTLFSWNIPNITNELGQVSRLIKAIFQRLEQFWHTEMKKDITTTTVANPIVNGREMRSQTLSLNMVNDSTNRVELREVDVIFQPSPGNTK